MLLVSKSFGLSALCVLWFFVERFRSSSFTVSDAKATQQIVILEEEKRKQRNFSILRNYHDFGILRLTVAVNQLIADNKDESTWQTLFTSLCLSLAQPQITKHLKSRTNQSISQMNSFGT
jgi:hypothetical protein